ncbi:ABC transporter ATP-binding protein/permease [Thiohalophilus sp.]|uniref:ABCB family ABC transporter ATP-binding protein/permease n=1 Tax=Thiohalophilus sp. TaxID=3028392 RepID=UPI002ACE69A9|nr:ABC transporter ATP-binding protein/permease [Thiohalophilus sp.]MDZ7804442.1 ABC transporter ATP-binding protein/permease [Thiohalophilus sp.]
MAISRYTDAPHKNRQDLSNLRYMLPYLWDYRGRVLVALVSLVLAKLATVGIPVLLKDIVDTLDVEEGQALVLPIVLFLGYGALRLGSSFFNEMRDAVFARVRYGAMRKLSHQVLQHLHRLSLRFHLERRTGNITRDLERGAQSVSSIMNYMVFNILPTIAEFLLVAVILLSQYEPRFTIVTFLTVAVYVVYTMLVSEWRMHFRHRMNAMDSQANGQAVDSLLNYETVKYFNNEQFELHRYHDTLDEWEKAAVKSQTSMSLLNFGQGAIIAVGLTFIMIYAGHGVVNGEMSLGDLVLVNTLMLQMFMPLSFLGIIYRMLKYTLADMDLVLKLLNREEEIRDAPDAVPLQVERGEVRFEQVAFAYSPDRPILRDVTFTIRPGQKVAVVGHSGAGKSTLARLLFRFYDVSAGQVLIDGQDIRKVTQESLRSAIGIVPQDTVLFNESIFYNIQYARPGATPEEIEQAARMAHIHEFIVNLPQGYDTVVGERGLKLSGGEKQRVAIARVILKNPAILVFDEATSSLDSQSEQAILKALHEVAEQHTTLVVAHRLSTIVDADEILVMEAGQILERGTHASLLARDGLYRQMWRLQQKEEQQAIPPSPQSGA